MSKRNKGKRRRNNKAVETKNNEDTIIFNKDMKSIIKVAVGVLVLDTVAVKYAKVVPTTAVNKVATAKTVKNTTFFFSIIYILLSILYINNIK